MKTHSYVRIWLRNVKIPKVAFVPARLWVIPHLYYKINGLFSHFSMNAASRIKSEYFEVSWKSPRTHPPFESSTCEMVQLCYAMGNHKWIVVRHACNTSTKTYVFGHTQCFSYEQVRSRYIFPLSCEVLTYPGFLVP